MTRMIKRKRCLVFKGEMTDYSDGFTRFEREAGGALCVGNSAWGYDNMRLTSRQAVALRKWLESTESRKEKR